MGTVVPFAKPEKDEPHNAGEALCIGCGTVWAAIAPVGTVALECPQCGTNRGVWRYPVGPSEGDMLFSCICGCEALVAYKRSNHFHLKCMCCGREQTNAVFGE